MKTLSKNSKSGPHKVAVLTDGLTQATRLVLAQIFESNEYEILAKPSDIDGIFYTFNPSVLVVDDSDGIVAPLVIRELAQRPEFYLLPTLILLSADHMYFRPGIESIASPVVLRRNSSILEAVTALKVLLARWESGIYRGAQRVRREFCRGREDAAIEMMMALISKANGGAHFAPALVPFLIEKGNLAGAERVLLSAIRKNPSKLSLIYSLIDLYLKFSHPELAIKVITALSRHAFSDLLLLDLVQARLLLSDVGGAIKALMRLDTLFPDKFGETIGKLAYADGNEALAVKYLGKKGMKNYEMAWEASAEKLTRPISQPTAA